MLTKKLPTILLQAFFLFSVSILWSSCSKSFKNEDLQPKEVSIQQIANDKEVIEFLSAPIKLIGDTQNAHQVNNILSDDKITPDETLRLAHTLGFTNVKDMTYHFERQARLANSIKKKYANFNYGYSYTKELISNILSESTTRNYSRKMIFNAELPPDCEKKLKLCESNARIEYSVAVLECTGLGLAITSLSGGLGGLIGIGTTLGCGGLRLKQFYNNMQLCNLSFAECQKQ